MRLLLTRSWQADSIAARVLPTGGGIQGFCSLSLDGGRDKI